MQRSSSIRGARETKADPYSPANSPRTGGASPTWEKENSTPGVKDAPDRVALTAVRVLEAVEQENKRLRTFVDSKDVVIDELKRQTKSLEEENKRAALAARKDANLTAVNAKLRKEIESLRKELTTLKEASACEQNALEHKAEISTMQLEQERFLKQRVQKEREQLEVQGLQSKELMEEYVHQIRVFENENDALKQAILDLRKERSTMVEKHAAEIEGMRKNWMTLLETSKCKPHLPDDRTSSISNKGPTLKPAVRDLLLSSLETVLSAFGHLGKSLQTDCDNDLPWLHQLTEKFTELDEAFIQAEAISSARDEILKMELRTSQEATKAVIEQQQELILQYREQLANYEAFAEQVRKDFALRSEAVYLDFYGYFSEAGSQQKKLRDTVSQLLEERNQIADCLKGTSQKSPNREFDLVLKLWDKLKDNKKPTPGPSVEEFEDLLSEFDARSSDFDRKEKNLVKQLDDMTSRLQSTQRELEATKKSLAAKTKELAALTQENAKLIQKYEQFVGGSGAQKKGSVDSDQIETTARGANEHQVSIAEMSKLKSELATKSMEVKEQQLEIESLQNELARKQTAISQMVQSIRESKQSSTKTSKASASSFVMLSTPSGHSSQALETPQLPETTANTDRSADASNIPASLLGLGPSDSRHSFGVGVGQRQPTHLQTQTFSRQSGPINVVAADRWNSAHRIQRSPDLTFDEDSWEGPQHARMAAGHVHHWPN